MSSSDEDVPLAGLARTETTLQGAKPNEPRRRVVKEKRKNDKKAASRVTVDPNRIWEEKERRRRGGRSSSSHGSLATLEKIYNEQIKPKLGFIIVLGFFALFVYLRLREEFYDHEKALALMHDSDDPFKVLEIERNATESDIKKAYFRLSVVWHPDKNPDCAECSTKFAQIAEAYRTLSDPEKRKKIEQGATKDKGESPIPSETFALTDANFDAETAQNDVWLIQVYTDWSTSAWNQITDWEKANDDIGRYINMGRINFAKEPELGRRFNIYDVPTYMSYVGGKTTVFRGRPNTGNFTNFMLNSLRNSVWRITDSNARIFLNENEDKVRVLLFANKDLSKLRLVYRSLARAYREHMVLGEVSQLDSPGLFRLYNASKDKPSLLFVKDGVEPLRYSGQMTHSKLKQLFEEHKYQLVPRLTSSNADDLCARADGTTACVVFFTDACPDKKEPILAAFRNASTHASANAMAGSDDNVEHPPAFVYTDVAKQYQLATLLNITSGGPCVAALQKHASLGLVYDGEPTDSDALLKWANDLSINIEDGVFRKITDPIVLNYEAPPINFRHLWRQVSPYITGTLMCVVVALLWYAGATYYKDSQSQASQAKRMSRISKVVAKEQTSARADKFAKLEEQHRIESEQRAREREAAEAERVRRQREQAALEEKAAKAAAQAPKSPPVEKKNPEPKKAEPKKPEPKKAEPKKAEKPKEKKPQAPSETELRQSIRKIVKTADLNTVTVRMIRKQLEEQYPLFKEQLTEKKSWIGDEIQAAVMAR